MDLLAGMMGSRFGEADGLILSILRPRFDQPATHCGSITGSTVLISYISQGM